MEIDGKKERLHTRTRTINFEISDFFTLVTYFCEMKFSIYTFKSFLFHDDVFNVSLKILKSVELLSHSRIYKLRIVELFHSDDCAIDTM